VVANSFAGSTAYLPLTGGTLSGSLEFAGTGIRVRGDFSNATPTNRVALQSNTTNGNTVVGAIPNGTAVLSALQVSNNSDLTAALAFGNFQVDTSSVALQSSIRNSGTYLPLTFSTGGSERMRIDTSGNLQFNSGYGSVATAYGCRAWVNFNGTGTVAIRTSGNVSSITDNGVGSYTINFAASLVDANYAVGFLAQNNSGGNADEPMVCGIYGGITPTTSGFRTAFRRLAASGGTLADTEIATFAVFR
jgi:hypothetical protein